MTEPTRDELLDRRLRDRREVDVGHVDGLTAAPAAQVRAHHAAHRAAWGHRVSPGAQREGEASGMHTVLYSVSLGVHGVVRGQPN